MDEVDSTLRLLQPVTVGVRLSGRLLPVTVKVVDFVKLGLTAVTAVISTSGADDPQASRRKTVAAQTLEAITRAENFEHEFWKNRVKRLIAAVSILIESGKTKGLEGGNWHPSTIGKIFKIAQAEF